MMRDAPEAADGLVLVDAHPHVLAVRGSAPVKGG